MTSIAVIGDSRSMPAAEIERALTGDRIVRVRMGRPMGDVSDVEIAVSAARPGLLREVLKRAPKLRWLHAVSAGVDEYLLPEIIDRPDLVMTNNSGPHQVPMSEFVLAVMLAAAKHIPDYERARQNATWEKEHVPAELRGANLVILGLGTVGTEVARLAGAFGMNIVGVRRHLDGQQIPGVDQIVAMESLEPAVGNADFLVVTAPLTSETRGLVSKDVLARLPQSAWVINVARGPIIDEDALFTALVEGRIAGAAIDAWWTEPLPAASKWWRLPNVIATPHASSHSPHSKERTFALFIENLRRWRAGDPLLNLVDTKAGY
jgi:phosphoglycerate dehydrogenase-like enzyme